LPTWLDVCAIAAPGREGRIAEPCACSVDEIAAPAAASLAELGLPVAVFGHSIGAWIGLEIVRLLRESLGRVVQFFPAAARPPHLGDRAATAIDDDSLIRYLRELGGTPAAVFDNRPLLELVLPILRADLALAAVYPPRSERVDVRATVLCGQDDPGLPLALAERWSELVQVRSLRRFPGGHFFPRDARDAVLATVIEQLRPACAG
jgi:surfactin synthase thioesterase subunit